MISVSQHLLQLFALCPFALNKYDWRCELPPPMEKVGYHTDQYHRRPDGRCPVCINCCSRVRVGHAAEHDDHQGIANGEGVDGQAKASEAPPRRRQLAPLDAPQEQAADGDHVC